ncbi:MAG: M1 family metallopeptidase [Bacteroidales bacterium]|nr:M1 family metallopeptidase [Bacteroidales bacterium]
MTTVLLGQESLIYDELDVKHHSLVMNITDFQGKNIYGKDKITLSSKQKRLNSISLNLLHLQVDSVWVGKNLISSDRIQYNDTLLTVLLNKPLKRGKEVDVTISYHGVPVSRSFGGFSWFEDQRMAHNMGVSINDVPHSFAKAWYPAVDDFRSKATYDFTYIVPGDLVAVGNGLLTEESLLPNGTKRFKWFIDDPIPDYLVNVAVGPYVKISMSEGNLPIDIYVTPNEYQSAKETFSVIPAAVRSMQMHFGPCAFDRAGYVTVNSPSGAMEHATNISIGRNPKPTHSYQETAIHELIHYWFGDDVTCMTAGDMWLTEGITSYMVEVVLEDFVKWGLAEESQLDAYRNSIDRSAKYINKGDKGYHPLAGTPESDTYGMQVYRRGAYVTRQLRQYLGDELFFDGMRKYVQQFHFKNATTEDFKGSLEKTTGKDLTSFFDEHIYN